MPYLRLRPLRAILLSVLMLSTAPAWAVPMSIGVDGFSLEGESDGQLIVPSCPPELGCSVLPQFTATIQIAKPATSPANPLVLAIAPTGDAFFQQVADALGEPPLTVDEAGQVAQAIAQQVAAQVAAQVTAQLSGGGTASVQFATASFTEDADMVTLNYAFEPGFRPDFLEFTLTDTVTGAFSTSLVDLNATTVPEPSTLALLGIGLAGLGWMGRRRKNV